VKSVSLIGSGTAIRIRQTSPPVRLLRSWGSSVSLRRRRSGRREPGVAYVDAAAYGADARESAERLKQGDTLGFSGRIERDEYRTPEGEWRGDHAVLIDQLDLPPTETIEPLDRKGEGGSDEHHDEEAAGDAQSAASTSRARARRCGPRCRCCAASASR
jgi:single-stranded DNA-binding protein